MMGEKDNWEEEVDVEEEDEEWFDEICRDKHSQTTVFICVQVDSNDKSQWNMKSISEYENDLSFVKTYEAAPMINKEEEEDDEKEKQ